MELWSLIKETVLKFHGVNLKNEDFMEFNLKIVMKTSWSSI
jgi:hypothetical protein